MKQIDSLLLITLLTVCLSLFTEASEARKSHRHEEDYHHGFLNGTSQSQFDYYLLALSWSPAFCKTKAGHQPGKNAQCSANLGFVVHGLWPQNIGKAYPHDCGPEADVPVQIAAIALNATPPMPPGDEQLLKHEWTKHGTCTGLNMTEYFTAIKITAEKIKIPESLKAPQAGMTMDADTITGAFAAANPGLTPEMIKLEIDSQNQIHAVQICFSRQLSLQNCPDANIWQSGRFLPFN